MMSYANNATIKTKLLSCNSTVNTTQIVRDLYDLYHNNSSSSVSNVFYNVSITKLNCNTTSGKYFEQLIIFTRAVSIRIQITLISIYFDFIVGNGSLSNGLHGLFIELEDPLELSSITLNYSAQSDACSSSSIAKDPLCLQNSSKPLCVFSSNRPWSFNCSENPTTSTTSVLSTIASNGWSQITRSSSGLHPWQIGLIFALILIFLIIISLVIGYFLRRHLHSKRITLSTKNGFDETKSMRERGTPFVKAFQRMTSILQSKQTTSVTIPRTFDNSSKNTTLHEKNYIDIKPAVPHHQATFIDHAKIYDPRSPTHIPPDKLLKPRHLSTDPCNILAINVRPPAIMPRSIFGTSINQVKLKFGDEKVDASNNTSLNPSNSFHPRKLSIPMLVQYPNVSCLDESLHDEDAWMSILNLANAQLDILDQLENEENQKNT